MKFVNLLIALSCLFNSAIAASATAPPSYVLDNTEVREIHAQALNRHDQVFVALPDSYRKSSKRYPVLFVVDANYSFPIVDRATYLRPLHSRQSVALVRLRRVV